MHTLTYIVATHEVADCSPTLESAPAVGCKWEPCVILKEVDDGSYDLQIISDVATCANVPKRFVRPLKVSKSKLWTPSKVQFLRQVMAQVRADIVEGTVMPATYMKRAVVLFQKRYKSMSRAQISAKWNYEVDMGRERPIISTANLPLPTPTTDAATATLTKGRVWADAETTVLTDILTGNGCVCVCVCVSVCECGCEKLFTLLL